jgi:hypothetical protein
MRGSYLSSEFVTQHKLCNISYFVQPHGQRQRHEIMKNI